MLKRWMSTISPGLFNLSSLRTPLTSLTLTHLVLYLHSYWYYSTYIYSYTANGNVYFKRFNSSHSYIIAYDSSFNPIATGFHNSPFVLSSFIPINLPSIDYIVVGSFGYDFSPRKTQRLRNSPIADQSLFLPSFLPSS